MLRTYGILCILEGIAAGVPISAIQDHSQDVLCPPDMIGAGEHFALEVVGDSMIEAGIYDGDTVIIRRAHTASNGDIVVALVEKEEATLKRLRKKGASIALEPEFWAALEAMAVEKSQTMAGLIREIDEVRQTANLSSAARVAVLRWYEQRARGAATT